MLEFIVSGQIPGTHLVLTFSWLIAVVTIAAGVAALKHTHKQHHHAKHPTHTDQISL